MPRYRTPMPIQGESAHSYGGPRTSRLRSAEWARASANVQMTPSVDQGTSWGVASAVKPRISVGLKPAGALLDRGARAAPPQLRSLVAGHDGLDTTRRTEKGSGARLSAIDSLRR